MFFRQLDPGPSNIDSDLQHWAELFESNLLLGLLLMYLILYLLHFALVVIYFILHTINKLIHHRLASSRPRRVRTVSSPHLTSRN